MTYTLRTVAAIAGALALTGCAGVSRAASASADADALRQALDDEYRAEAIYASVIDSFGDVRPFVNIVEAERRHADHAKADMNRLGITYDQINPYLSTFAAPSSVLVACKQGVSAEIENIALYDRLIPTIKDAGVRATLTRLQWASRERHLPAFKRCVARGGAMGMGRGRGRGRQANH